MSPSLLLYVGGSKLGDIMKGIFQNLVVGAIQKNVWGGENFRDYVQPRIVGSPARTFGYCAGLVVDSHR